MTSVITNTSIHNLILDAYKNKYEVSLASTTNINHLTQWVQNEMFVTILNNVEMRNNDLQDYTPSDKSFDKDWDFVKSSYFELLKSDEFKFEDEDDVLFFIEEWNELLQDFRWDRKKKVISEVVSKCLWEEDCDISDENSIEDFLYYVKNRIMNEVKTN